MRYIVNSSNYVLAVGFGCDLRVSGKDCTEYTGSIPSGWNSLEEWYEDEGDKLWRWKIVSGNLSYVSSAVAPEEGRWGEPLLQDKTAAGPFLTQTIVQPDANYDGLGKVTIPAQPYWVEVSESEVYTTGGYTLYVPLPVAGLYPKQVFVTFTSDPNLLSSNQIAIACIDIANNRVSFSASAGDGTFYHSLNASQLGVELYNSNKELSIDILSGREFYYSGTSMQTYYKVYLMY